MYYDSASRPSDVGVVEEVLQVYDSSGTITLRDYVYQSVFLVNVNLSGNIIFQHLFFLVVPYDVSSKIKDDVALYSEETLAAANIVTAICALLVGILLGVLLSKKCLNSNNLCNGSNSETSNWPSNKDHNCQFYISR